MSKIIIPIRHEEAVKYGHLNASVLEQIRYWSGDSPDGWLTLEAESLAYLCATSVFAVRRAVKTLVDDGVVEKRKLHLGGRGDQTLSYRPSKPLEQRSDDLNWEGKQ